MAQKIKGLPKIVQARESGNWRKDAPSCTSSTLLIDYWFSEYLDLKHKFKNMLKKKKERNGKYSGNHISIPCLAESLRLETEDWMKRNIRH